MSDTVEFDPVNKSSHYNRGKIEVIDFIEDQKLDFHLGNAVKYISRAGFKGESDKTVEDLRKAIYYLQREIDILLKGSRPEPVDYKMSLSEFTKAVNNVGKAER